MLKKKIFLLDDEPAVLSALKLVLVSCGHEVEAFDDVDHALSALQNNTNCQVFICDMRMPKMDGLTVLRKAKLSKPDIKFILMSAQLSKEELSLAKQYQVDGILDKPFGMNELNELIGNLIHG